MLPGIKTRPWPHQYKVVQMAKALPGFLLALDMGVGKSLCAIALIAHHSQGKKGERILIVSPKSVIDVWPSEFAKHMTSQERSRYLITPLNQRTVAAKVVAADRAEELAFQKGLIAVHVVNFDSVWRPEMSKWLSKKRLLCVVSDENHRIKSHNGRASRFMGDLATQADFRLGLTGTPLPHSPLDIFGQYRFLSKDVFGVVWGDFKARYAVLGGFENKQVVGYKNELDMNQRVEAISYRVKKSDVLTLPPVMHEVRHVELCAAAKAMYKTMKRDLYALVGDSEVTAANALVKVLRLLQITSGVLELDDGTKQVVDDSKIKGFQDLMEDMPAGEPVVIFSRFTRDIDLVRQSLAGLGRSCAVLDGRINQLAAWQAAEFDDIAVQIRAGGAGVDLTRAAYCVYYTQTHSLGDYDQSLARLDRPGQTRPVTYYHLVSRGTIDEQIYAALQQKRDVVEYILEGIKKETRG
jgi:SNF2 family DNA or RNA helicase